MAAPEIQVHAEFPHTVALNANLDIHPTNWNWVRCLTFPIETLNTLQFSQRPYKWIRYAIGVVAGMQGDLSVTPNFLDVVDYNASLPLAPASTILYYHTNGVEKLKMFPIDPHLVRSDITSSVHTTRRTQLRGELLRRDRGQCVLTMHEGNECDAAHLLTRSKGDEYISSYTRRRSRDPTGNDIVQDIDNIRNALLLNKITHVNLGKNVAFLVTPNFAMDTTDIEPSASSIQKRYTTHFFKPMYSPIPFGSPLRMPETASQWPPDIIFDIVYGGAVLCHFATQEVKDMLNSSWKESFYPAGVMAAANAEQKAIEKQPNEAQEKTKKQAEERDECHANNKGWQADYADMLMMLPYIMVPRHQLMAVCKEAEEKRAGREQRRVEEKVMAWAKDVSSAAT
ncbi:hypothetical protein APHAL10511_001411 [Amanita phalloides]|nr:hypothetical protein APHAL10511_001411 [Amanita phalloides]